MDEIFSDILFLFNDFHHHLKRLMNSRAKPGQAYKPTDVEHIANMITHGTWVIPSVGAMFWMVYLATGPVQCLNAILYGIALFLLFSVSTIYHTISYTGKMREWKDFFHIGDRAVIYFFIAASYTPWLTLKDMSGLGGQILWVVWSLAVFGIFYQYAFHEQYKWLETLLYLSIAICPAIVVYLYAVKDTSGFYELTMGGLTYVSGVVFFKCDGVIPFAHAIWHCFVLGGTLFHYYAICEHLLGHTNHLRQ
ncbi:hypothetical protein ScPMuIL_004502 [Solemya velum]